MDSEAEQSLRQRRLGSRIANVSCFLVEVYVATESLQGNVGGVGVAERKGPDGARMCTGNVEQLSQLFSSFVARFLVVAKTRGLRPAAH
jgi:hypothetical protein